MKLVAWNTLLTAILGLAVLGRRINAYCRKSALHPNAEYNRFVTAQLAPRLEAIVAQPGTSPTRNFRNSPSGQPASRHVRKRRTIF